MSQRTNEISQLCNDGGCLLNPQRQTSALSTYAAHHPTLQDVFGDTCSFFHLSVCPFLTWTRPWPECGLLTSKPSLHHSQAGFSQNNCDHITQFKTLKGPYQMPPMPRTLWRWRLAFLLPSTPFLLMASPLPCQPHIHFPPPTFTLLLPWNFLPPPSSC